MTRQAWLTPSDPDPAGTLCRVLFIPDDEEWLAIVSGALLELTRSYNYEQFGATTPNQIADRLNEMFQEYMAGCAATVSDLIIVRDKRTSGTNGGTFTGGSFQVRTLNDKYIDTANIASLSGNEVTIPVGVYRVDAWAEAYKVDYHQLRVWSATDATELVLGENGYSGVDTFSSSRAHLTGRFVLSGTKSITLQHRCLTTHTVNGLGLAGSWGDEIYTVLRLEREQS